MGARESRVRRSLLAFGIIRGSGVTGKVILVAGSTRGIGRAIAAMLLEEGARVCISGRDRNSLAEAQRELSERGPVLALDGDLSMPDPIAAVFERILAEWGALDGLVCNLGTGGGEAKYPGELRAARQYPVPWRLLGAPSHEKSRSRPQQYSGRSADESLWHVG